jgi:hypothetical protein
MKLFEMSKKKWWDQFLNWEEAEQAWNRSAEKATERHPLKVLKNHPSMPGITKDTAKHLKWKSLKWMVQKDEGWQILGHVLKRPWHYAKGYLQSLFSKQSFTRQGDFFLYNVSSLKAFKALLQKPNTLFVLGFSYCHKPFECPSGRFTDECIHDLDNPVCQQCFIGKCVHAAPSKATVPLYIPTVHYIGRKIFELQEKYPDKQLIFLITACEMTLTMFADWGNMVGIQGVGIRLDGRICNTMRAFALSEEGIKPGLTVVLDATQQQMLDFIRLRRSAETLQ